MCYHSATPLLEVLLLLFLPNDQLNFAVFFCFFLRAKWCFRKVVYTFTECIRYSIGSLQRGHVLFFFCPSQNAMLVIMVHAPPSVTTAISSLQTTHSMYSFPPSAIFIMHAHLTSVTCHMIFMLGHTSCLYLSMMNANIHLVELLSKAILSL